MNGAPPLAQLEKEKQVETNTTETDRFYEAEADVDHGSPWMFREDDAPNPLVIEATDWSTGVTKLGEAEWLNGVDRDGKSWCVLVGSVMLTKRLIEAPSKNGTRAAWSS